MSMMSGRKVQKIWLYEDTNHRIEGYVVAKRFDEYMNVVLDGGEELNVRTQSRSKLGRILLKGDKIILIHAVTI